MAKLTVQFYSTLDEAAKSNAFYVVNNTDSKGVRPKGRVIFGLKAKDGSSAIVAIPPTWIPIDLTTYLTPDDIVTSTVLRDYVRRQLLVLVTAESFEMMCKLPEYDGEFERVNKFVSTFATNTSTEMELTVGQSSLHNLDGGAGRGITPLQTPSTDMIMNASNDDEIVGTFDRLLPGLSLGELRYLSTVSPRGSLTSMVALEVEGSMTSGKSARVETIKDTEAYKMLSEQGIKTGPQFDFIR